MARNQRLVREVQEVLRGACWAAAEDMLVNACHAWLQGEHGLAMELMNESKHCIEAAIGEVPIPLNLIGMYISPESTD
jgi:hypothetical protein